ncbi:hypothetical protein MHM83_11045 [Tenacibaculum sp. Mcav3-52]|uniref:hypothetical protein n=1 Tax=Tenacibaculum sp. Mcav3-52 TaxID=2917762 RepID=UPI001EF39206|nr:hypothetical protein [Tenacibaculum sp. Mcav3-52]MCG7502409.1 hypothetical protein [Tenacibaculum sp. Mcav3-52]
MYQVTYLSLEGEVKQVEPGGESASSSKAIVLEIYKDCASVLFVKNIYSGEIVG